MSLVDSPVPEHLTPVALDVGNDEVLPVHFWCDAGKGILDKLDEKLANGEITQEQYDKMTEKKPGFAKEKMHPKKGFGRGKGICPQMKRNEAEASEGK